MAACYRLLSLNCSICDELLDDQKILNCAHTFCVKCLKFIIEGSKIKCPLCREVTLVEDGVISNLHTNLALSNVVEEVKTEQICAAQEDPSHNEDAVSFCHECDSNLCNTCFERHNQWQPHRHHKTVSIKEIKRQLLTTSTENKIRNSGQYRHACDDCNRHVSNSLKDSAHSSENQKVLTESEFKYNTRIRAEELQTKITETLTRIRTINSSYANLEEEVRSLSDNLISEINKVHNDKAKQLQDWRFSLTKSCQNLQQHASKTFHEVDLKIRSDSRTLVDGRDHVVSGLKDNHNIVELAELCENLTRLLTKINETAPDVSLEETMRIAASMCFHDNQTDYGELQIAMWHKSTQTLQVGKNMAAVDTNKEGCIAIGYFEGGVEFHEDGQDARIVLEDTRVLGIAFLSDSYLVLRDVENKVQLFSKEMEQQTNAYGTLTYEEGGTGCLAVDGDDNIFVNYRSMNKIQVFARKGGKVIRDIDCRTYTPQQIAVLPKQQVLVMDGSVIIRFNTVGPSVTKIMYPGYHGYPCVSHDGSVLVAWVDKTKSYLRIDKYTKFLKVVRCVYSSSTIDLSGRGWYFLRELPGGNLAICTSQNLIILKQKSEDIEFDWILC